MTTKDIFMANPRPRGSRRKRILLRAIIGGNIRNFGRVPRYLAFFLLGAALIWAPIVGYLRTAPLAYKSTMSLILPGSGGSASMNLNGIGQATSYANSAFSSNSISPTETYKRLLGADRILELAAASMKLLPGEFGSPRIDLIDQTSLIRVEITGNSPEDAQERGVVLLAAFYAELDALRRDEQNARADSSLEAIGHYRESAAATRAEIARLQRETGLVSADQYDAMIDATRLLESRVQDLAATLSEKQQSVQTLEATLGVPAVAAAATLKLFADAEYLALSDEIGAQATALAEARSQFGEGHPKVQEARSAYSAASDAALRQAIAVTGMDRQDLASLDLAPEGARAQLLATLVRMEAEKAGVEKQLATLTQRLRKEQATMNRLAPAAAKLQDQQRDFAVAEAVFASAIAKSQTTKSDVYASYPLVQVLENPSLPDRPSSPNRMLAFAAGLAATLMLLVGLMLGWIRKALISRIIAKPELRA